MLSFQFLCYVLVIMSSRIARSRGSNRNLVVKLHRSRSRFVVTQSTLYRKVFWVHRHFFGGQDVPSVDRGVRRVLVPLFLLLQVGMCTFPFRGSGAITGHRDAPLGGILFYLNCFCLAFYAALAVAGAALGIKFEDGALPRLLPRSPGASPRPPLHGSDGA